jgi:hypothetical protein
MRCVCLKRGARLTTASQPTAGKRAPTRVGAWRPLSFAQSRVGYACRPFWVAQSPVGAIRGYEGRDLPRSGSRTGERSVPLNRGARLTTAAQPIAGKRAPTRVGAWRLLSLAQSPVGYACRPFWVAQSPVGAIRGYEGRDLPRSGSRTGECDVSG